MQSRMPNPAILVPGALDALYAVGAATRDSGVPPMTIALVQLRASQINGCALTMDSHPKLMRAGGEAPERVAAVATWQNTDVFTDAERSALALAESVTRLADSRDPVPDEIWDEASRHYDPARLAGLLLAIATINLWDRLNVATRQTAGVLD
jgi:AhpD family alkylhydroperoxidase